MTHKIPAMTRKIRIKAHHIPALKIVSTAEHPVNSGRINSANKYRELLIILF